MENFQGRQEEELPSPPPPYKEPYRDPGLSLSDPVSKPGLASWDGGRL